MTCRQADSREAVDMTPYARGVHATVVAILILSAPACGETRTLNLFPKKAPMAAPTPMEPCGDLASCPPDRSVCFEEQCVECVVSSDCKDAKPVCLNGGCVECDAVVPCHMDKVCFEQIGKCTEPCTTAAECKDKGRPVCLAELGVCVACAGEGDCDDKHQCDPAIYACVGCLTDVDCGDAGSCDPTRGECAP